MKKYKDLNLKSIREKADLDFAHFTYKKGMCSCCYTPKDLPKAYWRNKVILDKKAFSFYDIEHYNVNPDTMYTYLLFKNADNGSGYVTREDIIKDYTCIEWGFPMEKLDLVCKLLEEQLDEDYIVEKPDDHGTCIVIRLKNKL